MNSLEERFVNIMRELDAQLVVAETENTKLKSQLRTANFPVEQATNCGRCGQYKHTPWKDGEYGYVCAQCLVDLQEEQIRESFNRLHEQYLEWVDETFPDESVSDQIKHLKEELSELEGSDFKDPAEFADVLMLLFCIADQNGVNVFQAFRDKFEVNKSRTWEKIEKGFRHK